MATKVRIRFNNEGFQQIVSSDAMMAAVEQAANGIKERADANLASSRWGDKAAEKGSGHRVSTHFGQAYGSRRALANVSTSGWPASMAEAADSTLKSAVM